MKYVNFTIGTLYDGKVVLQMGSNKWQYGKVEGKGIGKSDS